MAEDAELPELLYCSDTLTPLPDSVGAVKTDLTFGRYRRFAFSDQGIRDFFGDPDAHSGPYHFFPHRAFEKEREIAIVWARNDEAGDDLLKVQLTKLLSLNGVVSVRPENKVIREGQR